MTGSIRVAAAWLAIELLAGLGPAWSATAPGANAASPGKASSVPSAQGKGKVREKHGAKPDAGALPFVPRLDIASAPYGTLSLDHKGITARTADGWLTFRLGGRLNIDASAASLRPLAIGPALGDDVMIRRGRLEAYLTVADAVEVVFQYEPSDPVEPIKDAMVAYHGLSPFVASVGSFKEPFSLDFLTNSNDLAFVERSLLDALAPGRDFGAAIGASGDRWSAAGSVTGGDANTGIGDAGVAGTGRVTYAPILEKDQVLHVGLAGSYRARDGGSLPLSFDSLPENNLFATALVDTGTLRDATNVGRVGVEALYQWRSARLQGEYAATMVDAAGAARGRTFQAGYVQGAWIVNGQGRTYRIAPTYGVTFATLRGVEVADEQRLSNGGIGVFEIGARFSALDLSGGGTPGGRQHDVTLGLNWYPDANVKLMANYIHATADPSAAAVSGTAADSDAVLGRLQIQW